MKRWKNINISPEINPSYPTHIPLHQLKLHKFVNNQLIKPL